MKLAGYVGKAMKDALWAAAKATTVNTFTEAMNDIKSLDQQAYDWLREKHPSEWSKSYFSTTSKCDALVNNISESFNAMILDARQQPLVSCLETIRKLLMKKLFDSRQKSRSWKGPFCPNIMKKISIIEKAAAGCLRTQCDENLFEIRSAVLLGVVEQHTVDLSMFTCSCRRWDLTGIPCQHAVRAIWMKHGNGSVNEYVDPCYSIWSYQTTYGKSIKPLAGPMEWPRSEKEPPLPPLYTKKAGRPKKLRKRSRDEMTKDGTHVNRSLLVKHCKKCKEAGHNSRKCPQDPATKDKILHPKKRVRNKKSTSKATTQEIGNQEQVRVGVEVVDDPQAGEIHVTQPDEFIARPTQKTGNSLTPLGVRISWGSPT